MTDGEDCVFYKILAGELEASFVYRDALCSAFMDIQPVNAGHLLVVPIRHAFSLTDLSEDEGARASFVWRNAWRWHCVEAACGAKG